MQGRTDGPLNGYDLTPIGPLIRLYLLELPTVFSQLTFTSLSGYCMARIMTTAIHLNHALNRISEESDSRLLSIDKLTSILPLPNFYTLKI